MKLQRKAKSSLCFRSIVKPRWPWWPLIGRDVLVFSTTPEPNLMKLMKQVHYMFVFLKVSPKTKMAALTFGCPRPWKWLLTFPLQKTRDTYPRNNNPWVINNNCVNFQYIFCWLVVFRITSLKRYFSHITTWKQEITNLWNSSGEAGDQSPDLLLRKRSLTTRPSTCFLF